MKKFVQSLFAREKSASKERNPMSRDVRIHNSTIPKGRESAAATTETEASTLAACKSEGQKVSTVAIAKAAETSAQDKTDSAMEIGRAMNKAVQKFPVENVKPVATTTVAGLKAAQNGCADQANVRQIGGPPNSLAKCVVKVSKDHLKLIMCCPAPVKLCFNPQRNENVQQRIRHRKKELKQKMVAIREVDDIDRLVADTPIPVEDDEMHQTDELQLQAEAILLQYRDEDGNLQMNVNNGFDTLYTLYALRNRLDVVKLIYRGQMNSSGLFDLVDIRTPAIDGRTCLYLFAANFNLEGVRFCIQAAFPNPHEAWMTAAMAVLSAVAWHQAQPGDSEQFLRQVLGNIPAHLNDYLPWGELCLWLPQHEADGHTLLHFACQHCRLSHIKLLLEFGADPRLLTVNQRGRQRSAFEICREFKPHQELEAVWQIMTEMGFPVPPDLA